jgi:hypothetical protein
MSSKNKQSRSRVIVLAIVAALSGLPVAGQAATVCTSWLYQSGRYICSSWKTSSIAVDITSSAINGNLENNDKYVRSSVRLPAGSVVLYVCSNGGENTGYGSQVYPGALTEDVEFERHTRILKANDNFLDDKTLSEQYDFDLFQNDYLRELGEATCQGKNQNWHVGSHAYACSFEGNAKITDDEAGTDVLADSKPACSLPVLDCGFAGKPKFRIDSISGAAPATDYQCAVPQ